MLKGFYEWLWVYFYDKIIPGGWVRNMASRLTILSIYLIFLRAKVMVILMCTFYTARGG